MIDVTALKINHNKKSAKSCGAETNCLTPAALSSPGEL